MWLFCRISSGKNGVLKNKTDKLCFLTMYVTEHPTTFHCSFVNKIEAEHPVKFTF